MSVKARCMRGMCLYLATHPCSNVSELPGVSGSVVNCFAAAPLEVVICGSAYIGSTLGDGTGRLSDFLEVT